MASTQDLPSGSISIKTMLFGLFLGLCLALAGGSVYAKIRMDRAETLLAAPQAAFTPDQEVYEKTVLNLGYSGFLGSAQSFLARQDRAALADMRLALKTAQDATERLGEKLPAASRREIKGIMDLFAGVLAKAEDGSADAMSAGLSNADLLAAASALGVLDRHLEAATAQSRLSAQSELKYWSLLLTLCALAGMGLAALTMGVVLFAPRKDTAAPMRTLAQSVNNLTHGEVQKSIWGIERADAVGDVARAIDRARLFFAQIPDVAVMGADGPLRLKFEGESRSLFQNLMNKMSESFERAQQNTLGFVGTMNAQQDLMTSLAARVNGFLDDVQRRNQNGEESLNRLSRQMAEASRTLAQAHESGVSQLSRLVPMMQERVQNMAEVTHLAGTQVAQSLQSLMKSEASLRASAGQSHQTVQNLTDATSQMGERLFAALNLMQATGKVLGETIDTAKARFNDAVDTLSKGEAGITGILARAETRLASTVNAEENMAALAARTALSAEKLEKAVGSICDRHESVNEQVVTAAHRMDAIVANFDTAQRAMNDAAGQIRRDGGLVANLLSELRANNDQLLSSISQNSQTSFSAAQSLAEKSHALMQRLEIQIQQQAQAAETHVSDLAVHGQTMAQQATATTGTLVQIIGALKGEQEKLAASRARFTETVTDIGARLEQHATSTFGKTEQWAAQGFARITGLSEQLESVLTRLNMLGQLTGTLGAVAGQLGQLVPTLTAHAAQGGMDSPLPATVTVDMEGTKALILRQTEEILKELQEKWHDSVVQVEAMHDQLAQIMIQQKDQLETRLVVMDKKLRETPVNGENLENQDEILDAQEKQNEIINELVAAVSEINEHVLEIDEVIKDSGLRRGA